MSMIYKYPLRLGQQSIEVPRGAKTLSVQVQHGRITVWMLFDETIVGVEQRGFYVVGTGPRFDLGRLKHVGTVQDGELVWHVFEEPGR